MSTSWIVILGLFGFIILVLVSKILLNFFKKDQNPTSVATQENNQIVYEINFIKLEAIISLNKKLQSNKNNKISEINHFINNELVILMNTPEYIFNLHLIEMNDYIDSLIQQKLLKNSPATWNKKFKEEIILLKFKNKEWQNSNDKLKDLKIIIEDDILEGWENVKRNN